MAATEEGGEGEAKVEAEGMQDKNNDTTTEGKTEESKEMTVVY